MPQPDEAPAAGEARGQSGGACIIGAGSSGIAAAKVLHERGLPFRCYELGSGVGGNWRYGNDSGLSSAYRSLHVNTSRDLTAYSDFPMPREFPMFPHHSELLRYFESYVEHFGFGDDLEFRARIEHVEPLAARGFDVTISSADDPSQRRVVRHDSVLVANGHHWDPNIPAFDGDFDGEMIHARRYRTPDVLEGRRVLVVGMGNSGCDIACEASHVADRTFLSTRRGAHVIPKFLFGRPLDTICPPFLWRHLPASVLHAGCAAIMFLTRGPLGWYGLPRPSHRILEEHPAISAELPNLVGHGRICMKPDVARLDGGRVHFVDGSDEPIDVVVLATGYKISFPFLSTDVMDPQANQVRLFHQVIHPSRPGLFFIGLVQPWGAIMPLAEAQSHWVADVLEGRTELPPREVMERTIDRDLAVMRRRYTPSARHTIQVDFHPYLDRLSKERRRGATGAHAP